VTTALLCCVDLRIDADGATLIDRLTCSAAPDRVGLIGAWEPFFRYLTGRAELAAGSCELLGMDARHAVQSGVAGVASHDPPLPGAWSVAEYVQRSAELAGLSVADARQAARTCLTQLGLERLLPRRLASLTAVERRALGIAQASVTAPAALVLEAPLADLEEPGQAFVTHVIQRAAADRRLLCSARATPAAGTERGLIDTFDQVLLLEAGQLLAAGTPAELFSAGAVYRVGALSGAAALRGELERRGCRVFALAGAAASEADSARLLVVLPDGATSDTILDGALATEAAIIELVPAQAALDALGAS
jgi:ABC-type Na+ transport system ATPase subunit NatA